MNSSAAVRSLIDRFFSLQWCQENLVVPLGISRPRDGSDKKSLIIAIGNTDYLATIGAFIKHRAEAQGFGCEYIAKDPYELQSILEKAALFRTPNKDEDATGFEFDAYTILEDLAEADEDGLVDEYQFEFDDSEEFILSDNIVDFSLELCGSRIQKAAAEILISSCRTGVSDIHIEPRENDYRIRIRKDGVMQSYLSIPRSAGIKITACLKNMAKMDIAERRASQDGKILRTYEGQAMEFRCSTAPAQNGEKMVLRTLNSNEDMLSLDSLIINDQVRLLFRDIISEAYGLVVVSGPTGSGKSTTLASALREKDTGENNIVTAEDPIEYNLGGNIQQFPVVRAKGQTFANLLRTFLRQDPDVILIAEARDPETVESSMDAAETGHLVFTTLHANSAASSLTRLLDMEVPSYKLTTSLRGILAQRLLRRVCPECSIERPLDETNSRFTGLSEGTLVAFATALSAEEKAKCTSEGTLCKHCSGSGYKGRIGAYELMLPTESIRQAILSNKSAVEIENIAVSEGMISLKQYGVWLLEKKLTTLSELVKCLPSKSVGYDVKIESTADKSS